MSQRRLRVRLSWLLGHPLQVRFLGPPILSIIVYGLYALSSYITISLYVFVFIFFFFIFCVYIYLDLMISMISLFVSKSTIGLGTIIGSEIFNHLIISAFCVISTEQKKLKLNPSLFTREIIAYCLTLLSTYNYSIFLSPNLYCLFT